MLSNTVICGLSDSTVLLLVLLLLSLFYRVLTNIHLKLTIFLEYIVLQLFFIYNLCYSSVIFHGKYVFTFILVLSEVCL